MRSRINCCKMGDALGQRCLNRVGNSASHHTPTTHTEGVTAPRLQDSWTRSPTESPGATEHNLLNSKLQTRVTLTL